MPWKLLFSSWRGGGRRGVGEAPSTLPLCVARCPVTTSGHYKSLHCWNPAFSDLSNGPILKKRTSMFCLALKWLKRQREERKSFYKGENISGVYLGRQRRASDFGTELVPRATQSLPVRYSASHREMKTWLRQSFTLTPLLCSQPALTHPHPKSLPFITITS